MDKLKKIMKDPFDGLTKEDVQDKCFEIAKTLFSNYCINCNGTKYYFMEIEFYYYEKGLWDDAWNVVTYARNGYAAGDFFYHLSGIDICFESSYNNDKAKFGGVLIRAIKDVNNKIIAGPLKCKDEILNACKGIKMPMLAPVSIKREIITKATYRALGKDAIEKKIDMPYNLCFFDANKDNDWNPYTDKFNNKKGIINSMKGTYKTDRFYTNE